MLEGKKTWWTKNGWKLIGEVKLPQVRAFLDGFLL